MNRMWAWIIGVVIIAAAIVGIVATRNNNSNTKTTTTASSSSSTTPSSSSANQAATATDKVSIVNMSFSPADITVKKGTTVTWTNNDTTAHTVTENDGKNGPSAPPLQPGKGYSFTFNETGSFHYHCTIHQQMTGTVTVTQ